VSEQYSIHKGDCLDHLKHIQENSIDLILTSPPYDNLRDYNSYSFNFPEISKELYRVTKKGGVLVWVVSDSVIHGSESGTSFRQALHFKEIGYNLHDTMIWEKPNFSNPSRNRYHQVFEYMFILTKGKPKTFNPILDVVNKYGTCWGKNTARLPDGTMVPRPKNPGRILGMRRNVWKNNTVGQDYVCQKQPHPAMMPEKLVRDHITSWSNEGDTVLDPFLGSGTTGMMAVQMKRNFIGMEISEEYVNLARERIESKIRE